MKSGPLVVSTISSAGRSEQSPRKDDLASLRKDASLLAWPDLDRLAGAAGGLVVRSVGLHRVQPPVIPSQPRRLLKKLVAIPIFLGIVKLDSELVRSRTQLQTKLRSKLSED